MKPIKCFTSQITTCRKEYKIVTNDKICEPYYDDGQYYYKQEQWRKGKNRKKRMLMMFQVRMYKTWKHNRKAQYK
jgi:hypothetical protein